MKEAELNHLESFIPIMASATLKKAYLDTLANGNTVLEVIDNILYRVCVDGTKNKIKDIEPAIKFDISKKIVLK
jgi:hypothetical protein